MTLYKHDLNIASYNAQMVGHVGPLFDCCVNLTNFHLNGGICSADSTMLNYSNLRFVYQTFPPDLPKILHV